MNLLKAQALTQAGFAPYGRVIELSDREPIAINQGYAQRFDDLVPVDVAEQEGRVCISVFKSTPLPLPHKVQAMERHPLGSQTFLPLQTAPFLVLVADADEQINLDNLQLFLSNGRQGVHYAKNTWHHFLIALNAPAEFLVVDRKGAGNNLQEITLSGDVHIGPITEH